MKSKVILLLAIVASAAFWLGWFLRQPSVQRHAAHAVTSEEDTSQASTWTCPMHPQVRQPDPGKCPLCGMDLVKQEAGAKDPGPRHLEMSEANKKLAEILTTKVERAFVETEVRMVGMVDYDETRVRTISAWVPGRLDRLFVDFTGTRVRKGDHLVWLYSPQVMTAQEELLEAKRLAEQQTKERSEFLRDSSLRALESARDKLRLWGLSDAQIAEIEKRGTAQDHIMIPSPGEGIVTHKALNEGAYVKVGTPIYRIAKLDHLWIQLDAYESDLPWIRYGQDVSIETEALPGEVFRGWISFVAPELDRKTRTVKVRVNVENPHEKLKPGMFVRAVVRARVAGGGKVMDPNLAGKWICPMHPEVVEDEQTPCRVCGMDLVRAEELGYVAGKAPESKALVVPASAVLWTGKRSIVYVAVANKSVPTYEGREIILGPRAKDRYIVISGLQEGEAVVTKGAFKIDSALQILAKPSMMSMRGADPVKARIPESFRQTVTPLYDGYFEISKALAADAEARARRALETFGKTLRVTKALGLLPRAHSLWLSEAEALARAVARAKDTKGIKKLRSEFFGLSRAMLGIEESIGHAGTTPHYEVFCPMAGDGKGGAWLQDSEPVRNPYFGASMLQCGEVQKVHPGSGHGPRDPATKPQKKPDPAKPAAKRSEAESDALRTAASALAPVYAAYLEAQRALSGDDFDAAKQAFSSLDKAVEGVDMRGLAGDAHMLWMKLTKELSAAGKQGSTANDIASCRVAFKAASNAVLVLVTKIGHARAGQLYEHHCPMAFGNTGASWIQADDKLLNPYFGAAMLRCGVVKRKFDALDQGR